MATKIRTEKTTGLDAKALVSLYEQMVLARVMDNAERRLRRQQQIFFQISSAGQEAVQVAAAHLLRPGVDWFYPYYRDRALVLGLGVPPSDILLQAMGKGTDPSSGGREMPSHFGSPERHVMNQSSPTGTQFVQAVGTAEGAVIGRRVIEERLAESKNGVTPPAMRFEPPVVHDGELVYVSSGEGATSEGEFYEAVSAACLKRLPVLFLIQDNEYAISVPVEHQTPGRSISALFRHYPALFVSEVDGTDVLRSYAALRDAVEHIRSGRGPALVHAHVLRLRAHSDSDDDRVYKTEVEKNADQQRDPLPRFESWLLAEGFIDDGDVQSTLATANDLITTAIETAAAHPDPDPATVTDHVYAAAASQPAAVPASPEGPPVNMVEAIRRTLELEMENDPRVLVFGEDVADASRTEVLEELAGKGGVFKVTHGLQRRFGSHRVFNTPLAEAAIVGRAMGLAVRGWLPVPEVQFLDYIWPAMHQIRNELSMLRWRSNNGFSAPMVLRVPTGGYLCGGGPYHSQSAESIFCACPGLRVAMPATAADAAGSLRAALRSGDPVIFLEHKHLYRQPYAKSPYPGENYIVPLGSARTYSPVDAENAAPNVTIVTYGALVKKSMDAAAALSSESVRPEIVDLRWLLPYDWDAIAASVERTNRVVVASEQSVSHGFAAEIAARIADELFSHLDAPVKRVGARDVPVAYSPILEKVTLPQVEDVVAAIRAVVEF